MTRAWFRVRVRLPAISCHGERPTAGRMDWETTRPEKQVARSHFRGHPYGGGRERETERCATSTASPDPGDIRRVFDVDQDHAGNLPLLPAVFPDQMAPVVRCGTAARTLRMRWGFPPPPKVGNQPVTNVRNVASPFWRAWLKPEFRCSCR